MVYAGTPGPRIFPGVPGPDGEGVNRAEVHVELARSDDRDVTSYGLARRLRPQIARLAADFAAEARIEQEPTGPASRAAVVAEIFGPRDDGLLELAAAVEEAFERNGGLGDIDRAPEPGPPRLRLRVDYDLAASRGVSAAALARTVRIALAGERVGLADLPDEPEPVPIRVRLPRARRSSVPDLAQIYLLGSGDRSIPLVDLAVLQRDTTAAPRLRKHLLPVAYVSAALASADLKPIYAQLDLDERIAAMETPAGGPPETLWREAPDDQQGYAVHWTGEWEYTYEVYRDLGLAALGVLVLIYLLMVGWFGSFLAPVIIMLPIPLTLVGVIPAHWLYGISMSGLGTLGVIALAGIVARNSILLVDFIRNRAAAGLEMKEAVIRAGAVRTRPVVLTALTVIFGSGVLILDPSLEGLGLTLASGALVTTMLTLLLIPVIYHHAYDAARQR